MTDRSDQHGMKIPTNERRKKAWANLEKATRQMQALDEALLDVLHFGVADICTPGTLDVLKEIQLDLEIAAAHAQERLAKCMHRNFSNYRSWLLQEGQHQWRFSYSIDRDGDGWYWWRVEEFTILRIKHIKNPFADRLSRDEGRCRKRKDAKRKAYNAFRWQEHRLAQKEVGLI